MADFDRPDDNNGAWDYYQIYYPDDDYFTTENDQNKKYKHTRPSRMWYDPDKSNENPDFDDKINNDDYEEEVNTTQPFTPGASSTPYQPQGPYHGGEATEMSNMEPEDDDLAPLIESFITENERQSAINRTINLIKFKFKTVDLKKNRPNRLG